MRLKSLLFSTLGIISILALFQSCTAVQEATADYDIVIGDDYVPPIKKVSDEKIPESILLIPIPKNIPPNYFQEFVTKFVSYYKERNLTLPRGWENSAKYPTPAEVQALKQDYLCDGVLFLEVQQLSAYPPLRLKVETVLQLVKNDFVIWRGVADYDGSQELVANSARRFLQKQLRRPNAPDKSLSILKNNYLFIHFAAFNLAKKLNNITNPPPDPNAPKDPTKEGKPQN